MESCFSSVSQHRSDEGAVILVFRVHESGQPERIILN